MIFDCALTASGHNNDLVATRRQGLLHPVLDDGFIHQGEHLFRLSFGGGQEARAQTGSGENRFAYFHFHGKILIVSSRHLCAVIILASRWLATEECKPTTNPPAPHPPRSPPTVAA